MARGRAAGAHLHHGGREGLVGGSCGLAFIAREQRIELARAVERIEFVAAADMGRADENLRHGRAAVARARSSRCGDSGSLPTRRFR